MRVLELTAHVQAISRKDGRTATAAAAYRACDRIGCDREGVTHDYRRKKGLESTGIVLPDKAPAGFAGRAILWNAAELRERNGSRGANAGSFKARATVAREIVFGFPAELSPEGRRALADRVARHLVEMHGVGVDFALHAPGRMGDQRNHHAHLMMTTRRITADGLTEKAREWDGFRAGSRTVTAFRAFLAGAMNEALAAEGHSDAVHVEHRSLKARGISRTPTKHMGPGRTNSLRQRQRSERHAWEREIRREQAERHAQERGQQRAQHEAYEAAGLRDINAREARDLAAMRDEATITPPPIGRAGRLWRSLTGRAEPSPAPTHGPVAEHRRGEVHHTYQAERDQLRADHSREARTLAERHRDDDRQLDRAALARVQQDRMQEVQERHGYAAGRVHERTHDREGHRMDERTHEHETRRPV